MIRLLFLGLIVAAYAAACVVSPYGFWMTDLPRVVKIAEVPVEALPDDAENRIRWGGLQIPVARPDLPFTPTKTALGYSYRNFEALKLPFVAYQDQGFVLYAESRKLLQIVPLDADEQAALAKAIGKDFQKEYSFPWWQFAWGWLFVAALALWLLFQYRHEYLARKRMEEAEDME